MRALRFIVCLTITVSAAIGVQLLASGTAEADPTCTGNVSVPRVAVLGIEIVPATTVNVCEANGTLLFPGIYGCVPYPCSIWLNHMDPVSAQVILSQNGTTTVYGVSTPYLNAICLVSLFGWKPCAVEIG